jgi:hypothetical protein
MATFRGTHGDDNLSGTSGDDDFILTQGGNDTVNGGDGNDTFRFGGTLTAADHIDGGNDTDTVVLQGDYSSGLTFAADTMVNVEILSLMGTFNYNLTTNDATVAAGATLLVRANGIGGGGGLIFDGSAETDGHFRFLGSTGDDVLTGGAKSDVFHLENGGFDTARGGGGYDIFYLGAALVAADTIDGGTGNDTLVLNGDYSGGLTFGAATMTNVETLTLDGGFSYNLTTDDANVAAGATLAVDASTLGAGDALTFDGSAETDGHFAVTGGAGDDTLTIASAAVMKGTTFSGGGGNDTLVLAGDNQSYALGAVAITSVETLVVNGDFSKIVTNDGNVATGATLNVDLSQADFAIFDGSKETDGNFHFISGMQNETMRGGAGGDTFDMTGAGGGGSLAAFGNGGDDLFVFAGNFGDTAAVNGGAGNDTVELNGDYSGVVFASYAMTGIETLKLDGGHSYDLTTNNANVSAGQTLTVDASALSASDTLAFNGAAESDGFFSILGGAGDDTIFLGAHFRVGDTIDGGPGTDTLELKGDYSSLLSLVSDSLMNVETLRFDNGFNYNLQLADNVQAGQTLTVDASLLTGGHALTFDGSQSDGHIAFTGGTGNDTLIGSTGGDTFIGGLGADNITGNASNPADDIFIYNAVAESTGVGGYDTIASAGGKFDLYGAHVINNVDAGFGSVSTATFDNDIYIATTAVLGPGLATVVHATGGDLVGHEFLVVDVNGDFAYEPGTDYVFDVTNYSGLIDGSSFI